MSKSYRLKCRNTRCGSEFHRYWPKEEFEKMQYPNGIGCFKCGFPRMIVIKSNRLVDDGFKPGFQRNIMKHCSTYGEYKAWLKKLGLIEIGYSDIPEEKEARTQYWDDEKIKKLYDILDPSDKPSGREIEYLKQLHKDDEHISDIESNPSVKMP